MSFSPNERKLRIAIDCRIHEFQQGVGTAVIALAKGLSESGDLEQEYTFIVREDNLEVLRSYVHGPCTIVGIPAGTSTWKQRLKAMPGILWLWKKIRTRLRLPRTGSKVPVSDGFVESHGFDVVHFPTQLGYETSIPTIYHPWDLQHLHYPDFFTREEIDHRETSYRRFCDRATYVCVQAHWTKNDLMRRYGIAKDKIVVIPWGSVFDAYEEPSASECEATIARYDLPSEYFLYPAKTWPHKNHEVIIQALEVLKKEHGRSVHVIFTGAPTERRKVLDKMAERLGVSDQIRFLGFVPAKEVQAIFRYAMAMVFPSKFEGFGLPLLEAFRAKVPVLSSLATTLPEVGQDAALYFDPDSAEELSRVMLNILESPELRRKMIERGTQVLSACSMSKTVGMIKELYRDAARGQHSIQHDLGRERGENDAE